MERFTAPDSALVVEFLLMATSGIMPSQKGLDANQQVPPLLQAIGQNTVSDAVGVVATVDFAALAPAGLVLPCT